VLLTPVFEESVGGQQVPYCSTGDIYQITTCAVYAASCSKPVVPTSKPQKHLWAYTLSPRVPQGPPCCTYCNVILMPGYVMSYISHDYAHDEVQHQYAHY
jgi:hypothetical protein